MKPKTEQPTWMVRWKRTAKHGWYYLPPVYENQQDALDKAERASKNGTFYRLEVVELTPRKVWPDDSVSQETVEQEIRSDG